MVCRTPTGAPAACTADTARRLHVQDNMTGALFDQWDGLWRDRWRQPSPKSAGYRHHTSATAHVCIQEATCIQTQTCLRPPPPRASVTGASRSAVGEAVAAADGRQRLQSRQSAVAEQRLHGIDGTIKEQQEQSIDGARRAHLRHRCCSAKRQRPRPRSGRACQRSPRCSTRRTGCRLPVTHGRRKRE